MPALIDSRGNALTTWDNNAPSQPLVGLEVASTGDGRDLARGWVDRLAPQQPGDPILQAKGAGDYQLYRDVLSDWQCYSTLQQRRDALISAEWRVEAGGDKRIDRKAADFLKEQLQHVGWDRVTRLMHFGVWYGWSVAELVYQPDGATIALEAVRVKRRSGFGWRGDGALIRYTIDQPRGEEMPPRKFWVFSVGADHDDEPYGLGLAHWAYWPVFFKRGGVRLWLRFLDKFSQPTAKGTYPRNAQPDEKARLLATLRAIATDSGVIVPEGMQIDLLEAARSGTVNYVSLARYMDEAIAKVNLSQTLTSENTGGQVKGQIQNEVRLEVVKSDADLLDGSFNAGPVRWLVEWNFPGAALPRVYRDLEPPEDLGQRADRDTKIYSLGYEPEQSYIDETYGPGWVKRTAPDPAAGGLKPDLQPGQPGQPAAFAEGDAQPTEGDQILDEVLAALPPEQLQGIEAALIRPLAKAAWRAYAGGATDAEVAGRLRAAFGEADSQPLHDLLTRIDMVARFLGRLEAEREMAGG